MASTLQITQDVIEVVQSETPASLRVTQDVIEVVQSERPATLRVTQAVIEVIRVRQAVITSGSYKLTPTIM